MRAEDLIIHKTIKRYFSEQVKRAFPDFEISDAEMEELALRYSLDEILLIVRATEAERKKKSKSENPI